jgi:hypothetical protein
MPADGSFGGGANFFGGGSFEAAPWDYIERQMGKNTAASTCKDTKRIVEQDVIPVWGATACISLRTFLLIGRLRL